MNRCFKYIVVSLTMIAVVITTFSKSIILFNFYLNQRYIIEQYCVNKDKPLMHCNGHCYLQKQMQREQQQEQALADAFGKNEVAVCQHYFPTHFGKNQLDSNSSISHFVPHTISLYQRLIDKRLLKPPIL